MMGYGEPFGDLEIVRPLTTLRSATIYEALRGKTKVLLKVAHDRFHDKLKREAQFLSGLQKKDIDHPFFPKLLNAHPTTTHAYGKTTIGKRVKYYCVFEHVAGELLSELLLKTPQPWFKHVGWIGLSLTSAIGFLHEQRKLHLMLYPEAILLFYDQQDVPRMTLLDLGMMVWPTRDAKIEGWVSLGLPHAYTAPELLKTTPKANRSTDVYGIGLILYEMLAGYPAFANAVQSDFQIRENVLKGNAMPITRPDLTSMPKVAKKAISFMPKSRFAHPQALADVLQETIPPIPEKVRESAVNWRLLHIALWVVLIVSVIVILGLGMVEDPNNVTPISEPIGALLSCQALMS